MSKSGVDLDFRPDDVDPLDDAAFETVLKPKQEVLIQEYLIDLNMSAAALRTGISPQTASEWIHLPAVGARIRRALAQRITRTKFTQDQVLHELSLLANSRLDWFYIDDAGQVALTDKAPEGAMGAVASIKRKVKVHHAKGDDPGYTEYDVEIKLWDKPTPLKLMGRHVGLFPDKMEHSGPGGGPIPFTEVKSIIVDPVLEASLS